MVSDIQSEVEAERERLARRLARLRQRRELGQDAAVSPTTSPRGKENEGPSAPNSLPGSPLDATIQRKNLIESPPLPSSRYSSPGDQVDGVATLERKQLLLEEHEKMNQTMNDPPPLPEISVTSAEEKEATRVMRSSISQTELFSLASYTTLFEIGAVVEARWHGGPIFYRGKIAATNGHRFVVAFDDGTVERAVRPEHMRRPQYIDRTPRTREEIRQEILAFYEKYNPSKLGHVDALLDRCPGNEEALLEAIKDKYQGIEATDADICAKEAENQFSVARKHRRVAQAALSAAKYSYASARNTAAVAELYAIYARKKPHKVPEIKAMCRRAGGPHELLAIVRAKYLPRPSRHQNWREVFQSRAQVIAALLEANNDLALRLKTLDARIGKPLALAKTSRSLHPLEANFIDDVLKLVAECDGLGRLADELADELRKKIDETRIISDSPDRPLSSTASCISSEDDDAADAHRMAAAAVGQVFAKFGPFFKMFAAYARRFQATVQARAYLAGTLAGVFTEDDDLDVSGTLAAPVDHVRELDRLLGHLVELTPSEHFDCIDTRAAWQAIQDALSHVDQTLQQDVTFKRLVQILDPNSLDTLLDVPTRKLVKEGKLHRVLALDKIANRFYPDNDENLGNAQSSSKGLSLRALALSDRLVLVTIPTSTRKEANITAGKNSPSVLAAAFAAVRSKSGGISATIKNTEKEDPFLAAARPRPPPPVHTPSNSSGAPTSNSKRRGFFSGTNTPSPSTSGIRKNNVDGTPKKNILPMPDESKGKLAHTIAYKDITVLEACDDEGLTDEPNGIVHCDSSDLDAPRVTRPAHPAHPGPAFLRLETPWLAVVLRSDAGPTARDAWLQTLDSLRRQANGPLLALRRRHSDSEHLDAPSERSTPRFRRSTSGSNTTIGAGFALPTAGRSRLRANSNGS